MPETHKVKCFYHAGDWDGRVSGAIIRKFFNPDNFTKLTLHPVNYGDTYDAIFSAVDKDDTVFMVDLAMKPISNMVKLANQCKELVWIDHHSDSINMAKEIGFNPNGLRVDGIAACLLTWQWFYGDSVAPEGLILLAKYDVGCRDDDRIKTFQAGMEITPKSPKSKIIELLLNDDKDTFDTIMRDGPIIREYQKHRYIDTAKANGFDIDFGDYRAFAINGFVEIDDLIDEEIYDSSKYSFLMIFEKRKGWWKFSLRSRGNDSVDVSAICRMFGGGGHAQASGFETNDNELITRMIEGKIVIKKEQ